MKIENLKLNIKTKNKYITPVDNVSLEIKEGETVALLGESGCGKSMLANSIIRLLPPNAYYSSSSKIILGSDLLEQSEYSMRKIRGNDIAIIFQDALAALNPVLTIGYQLVEILKNKFENNYKQLALELLHEVGLPDPNRVFSSYAHQLSGGMRQRALIAIALAARPKLLIADEPTTALDVTIQLQILKLIKKLQQRYNMSMLFITHDMGVVSAVADRVAVMYAGNIIEFANKNNLLSNPRHPYTKMLMLALPDYNIRNHNLVAIKGVVPSLDKKFNLCRFKDRCPIAGDKCNKSAPNLENITDNLTNNLNNNLNNDQHLVRCFYSDKIDNIINTEANYQPHTIDSIDINNFLKFNDDRKQEIDIKNLSVNFPIYKGIIKKVVNNIPAVSNVSFSVTTGSTLSIVGESGSGKTTVLRALVNLAKSTGVINIDLNKVQIIFQDPYSALNPKMMVSDIIQEGYKACYGKNLDQESLLSLLDAVSLPSDALSKYPHEFSGGQRQRVAIARALAVKPKVLLLDEPTSALDVSVQAQILNLLKKLQSKYNITYILVTHNISVVGYISDYIAVMYLGKIVEYGSVDQILNSPKHPYTQSLLSSALNINNQVNNKNFDNIPNKDIIKGEIAMLDNLPSGCHFRTRCPHAMDICKDKYPDYSYFSAEKDNYVSCYLYDKQ